MPKVLNALAKATGLTFVLDEGIKSHKPKFGGWSFRDTPAHIVMRAVAKIELIGGDWKKTETGYCLTALGIPPSKVSSTAPALNSSKPIPPIFEDPRLKVTISVLAVNPPLRELLAKVQSASGVRLGVADTLDNHDPKYGNLQLKNAPAWTILRLIAEQQLKDGSWEKDGDGYRLVGVSVRPGSANAPISANPKIADGSDTDTSIFACLLLWPAVGGVLLAVAGCTALILFRRRKRARVDNQPPSQVFVSEKNWLPMRTGFWFCLCFGPSFLTVAPLSAQGTQFEDISKVSFKPAFSPLRTDPKLHAKVNVVGTGLTLGEILKIVEKATQLDLIVDLALGDHQPDFGAVQTPEAPAWAVLELIVMKQLDGGHWVKTDAGYKLTAKASLAAQFKMEQAKAKQDALAKAVKAGYHPLSGDPRLTVKLTVVERDLPLDKLLARLQAATTLTFTLDENLTDHAPQFGKMQLKNAPAWSILEYVAGHQVKEGGWEKTDNGYRLHGVSTAPRLESLRLRDYWPWQVAGLILLVLVAAGFVVLCVRAVRQKPAKVS